MTTAKLTKKDFKSDQDVRWCPGCGDYAILNAVQGAFAKLGKNLDNTVIISGIGCSSRFPYYMETYGFHTIHGRAPALATGTKVANPDLDVWVITGDGDALSIGGNHFIHAMRRNVGLKILLFNNRIYGLTKGQYSPTSEQGKRTKSTPMGSVDYPFSPINLALGAGCSFVARSVDVFLPHLEQTILEADAHDGTALVEIYQNCNIFNDGAYKGFTDKDVRGDRVIELSPGQPMTFGDGKGLAFDEALHPQVVDAANAAVWNEAADSPGAAMALAAMSEQTMPVPIGIFRRRSRPAFETAMHAQIATAKQKSSQTLTELLNAGDTWTV